MGDQQESRRVFGLICLLLKARVCARRAVWSAKRPSIRPLSMASTRVMDPPVEHRVKGRDLVNAHRSHFKDLDEERVQGRASATFLERYCRLYEPIIKRRPSLPSWPLSLVPRRSHVERSDHNGTLGRISLGSVAILCFEIAKELQRRILGGGTSRTVGSRRTRRVVSSALGEDFGRSPLARRPAFCNSPSSILGLVQWFRENKLPAHPSSRTNLGDLIHDGKRRPAVVLPLTEVKERDARALLVLRRILGNDLFDLLYVFGAKLEGSL